MAPTHYLQSKSPFSVADRVTEDPEIVGYIKSYVNNCWVAKYVKTDRLSRHQLLDMFNICILTERPPAPTTSSN
uniref:Uncharacterized protein n=1 Tax=Ignisphaera aggregans TaxID=334771 RepID=A0A7J3Z894_9CREN